MDPISTVLTLDAYLTKSFAVIAERVHLEVSPSARVYVTALLGREVRGAHVPDEPLTYRLRKALDRGIGRAVRRMRFQEVGDASLVYCGLWWMRQERPLRPSNLDFYLGLGPMAYRQLDEDPLFAELGTRFGGIVDVLARMELTGDRGSADDVVRLFRLWERTHSIHAARILADRGLIVGIRRSETPS